MNNVVGVIDMSEVMQKYRLIILALALILIAALIWMFMAKQESDKVPSRGVFVEGNVDIKWGCA
jgi:hypothetical protein